LEKNKLPQNWKLVQLSEITQINPPKPEKNSVNENLEVTFLPMKNVEELTGKISLSETRKYFEVKKGFTYFKDDDIIFAKITPCMENGKIAIIKNLKNNIGFGSTEFTVIRKRDKKISERFYFWYLIQDNFRNLAKQNMRGTAGQKRVPTDYLKNFLVPLPPIEAQKRIVEKIEELLSLVDNSKKILENNKLLLKQYRSSILKSAFTGELTKKWREDKGNNIQSGHDVLQIIRTSRENKIKKITKLDLSDDLYPLPEEWIWANIFDISTVQTGPFGTQLHKSDYTESGTHVIEIGDVHPDRNLSEGSAHYVSNKKAKMLNRFTVQENDILFTRVGTVGRCTVVPKLCDGWLMSTSLIRVRASSFFNSKFLFYYFVSPIAKHFTEKTSLGTTRKGTNSKIVGSLPMIIVSSEEQKEIISIIEEAFSLIKNAENITNSMLKQSETLRSCILKLAFQGKLVPQDPNDEPASELLKRIQQKRNS